MRRTLMLVVVALAVATIAPAATADGSNKGILMAGFDGGLSGGSAVRSHNDTALVVSAAAVGQYNGVFGSVPDGRIVPFVDLPVLRQVRCDNLFIGTWLTLFSEDKSLLALTSVEMWLDGEQLDVRSTQVKPFLLDDIPEDLWGINHGVPVVGKLPPGDYNLVTDTYLDGDLLFHDDIIFTVDAC